MKAIPALTTEEYLHYQELYAKLRDLEAGKDITYNRKSMHAKYSFEGTYTQELIDKLGRHPTDDEIILLVDRGFSHFGAGAYVDEENMSFRGYVYTD